MTDDPNPDKIRYYPTKKDAAFWADLSYTLIHEITCKCGHVNKVPNEWHTGYFRAECGGCYEELDLHGILHTPDRTAKLIQMIDEDKEVKIKRGGTDFNDGPDMPIGMPPEVEREVNNYLKFLQEEDRKKEEAKKEKRKPDIWGIDGDLIEWDDARGEYVKYKPKRDK